MDIQQGLVTLTGMAPPMISGGKLSVCELSLTGPQGSWTADPSALTQVNVPRGAAAGPSSGGVLARHPGTQLQEGGRCDPSPVGAHRA